VAAAGRPRRAVREETGLSVELVAPVDGIESETVEPLPRPPPLQLADVNVHDGAVGHQHVDFVYYARAGTRDIDPADGERSAGVWQWVEADDLRPDRFDPDVAEIGRRAVETV